MSAAASIGFQTELTAPLSGLWRDAARDLRHNPAGIVGFALIGIFLAAGIGAPLLAPHSPLSTDLLLLVKGCCGGPSQAHPFGVDDLGRDELSRVLYGARTSLLIGFGSVGLAAAVGGMLALIAAYGRVLDTVVMRFVDVMLAIPGFLMALAVAALLGPGIESVLIAIGVANVPIFARVLRGSILAQREKDFVLAARAVGVRHWTILWSHVLPNAISPLIVQVTLSLGTAVIDTAGLGFLGLGPQNPATPEWGTMLTSSVDYLQSAPFLVFFPGGAIVLVVMGFNLAGDALREALDPKLRGRV